MAERASKRPAGVTRIPSQSVPAGVLKALDLTGLTRPQLERVAADLGLSTTGSDSDLRQRIHLALLIESGYVDVYQEVYG